ncbi:MAG: class I tRNA ligase family protein [Candidatus Nealsonbacteria bacterium]|nr:class I tRNA ligase family protein [Candidatus Nealsonbacteria bacterium]
MEFNLPKIEKNILAFWKTNKTFEKSIKQRDKARSFVFYEGPPTANGRPGIHHVLARTYKDIVCRYKTMQGFSVQRKAGWDTHGLPVELEIEKKLGLKNKKDIEKYGIAKFNRKCRESVWQYKDEWEKLTERIGYWLDMENPYITYENNYIESLWRIIKQIHQKGLLYKGYKVVPFCPRCGTSLSSHEVALGYKNVKEPSIYVKLKIKPNTYLLVWTTTPWTLPANVAVAINPKFTYVKAKVDKEIFILAKERLSVLTGQYKIISEFSGKKLLKLKYEPLFKFEKPDEKAWFIVPASFVSLNEGTGLVHLAPAFGVDDMNVGKKNKLPVILNVDEEGKFKKEVKNWAGMFVKEADPLIIAELKKRGFLFKEEMYEHDYPFCWRCSSALLYYAKESWFINMQKVKGKLLKNSLEINWVPSHLKEGRFGEWLEEVKDWAFSRERYWGTPLPIWQCQKCHHQEVIGSKKELLAQNFSHNNYYFLRHGESLKNIKKVNSCWPETIKYPLTKKGKKQIEKAAKELKNKKIDLIFSSDLLRTKQTAEIIAKELKAKVIYDQSLRDYNVGIFNNQSPKKIWEYVVENNNIFYKKAPRGESWTDLKKRMFQFIKKVDKKYSDKNILIISHEGPLSLLEASLKGTDNKEFLNWRKDLSIKVGELRRVDFKNLPYNKEMELDFHRPYIDQVKFDCLKCHGLMERIPELIDVWFDSGSMPFAQGHYPFEKGIQFPADYICEAIDQTRGWFYTLLAVSTLVGLSSPYKNVISLSHVLDEKGEKMSKSKGNVVDPWLIIDKYGADAVRWYFYTMNQPGDVKLFSEKELEWSLKKFIMTYWNSYLFFGTYKSNSKTQNSRQFKSKNLLDRWIVSRLNELIKESTKKLNNYDITSAARAIENFVINDLSLWYIRRSRRRFQKPKSEIELEEASSTLNYVLIILTKLTAPFVPFLSEEIYKELTKEESCHLADWPKIDSTLIDENLEKQMEKVREIVAAGLSERAKAGIKVRQPLISFTIKEDNELKEEKEALELIKEEINVKKILFGKELKLDIKITPELEEEGIVREVVRHIQEMRKQGGYRPEQMILVQYFGQAELNRLLNRNKEFIIKETNAQDFCLKEKLKKVFDVEKETKVGQNTLWLAIKKIK